MYENLNNINAIHSFHFLRNPTHSTKDQCREKNMFERQVNRKFCIGGKNQICFEYKVRNGKEQPCSGGCQEESCQTICLINKVLRHPP